MKQKLVDLAKNNLRIRKTLAEESARQNLLSALKNQEFKRLFEEYQNKKIEDAKNEAFGNKVSHALTTELETKMSQMLKTMKIGSILPEYNCKKCGDSGIINETYCECLKSEIAKILLKQSGFSELEEFSDSDFSLFENPEMAKKIYALLEKWCLADTKKSTVYLLGPTGTGKTHLLKCMAKSMIDQGKITLAITAYSLNQKFLKLHLAKEDEKKLLLDELLEIEVLFIDDLGTEPMLKNVTREYLYLLINERQNRNLRTVITSNLAPNDVFDRYDERIYSRLMNKNASIVLEMGGSDLRLKNRA